MFVLNIYNNNKYVVFALRCQQSSDRLSEVDMLVYIAYRSDLLLQIRFQRRYNHSWFYPSSEVVGEMTESLHEFEDCINADIETLVERGDVKKAFILAS